MSFTQVKLKVGGKVGYIKCTLNMGMTFSQSTPLGGGPGLKEGQAPEAENAGEGKSYMQS